MKMQRANTEQYQSPGRITNLSSDKKPKTHTSPYGKPIEIIKGR